jgi:hypothetical protein
VSRWSPFDEQAHRQAVVVAAAGMSDPALAGLRLVGPGVALSGS